MFSNILKKLRKDKKITQEGLAKIIGVERSTIGKYESTSTIPSPDVLGKLADYFDVTVDYLLGREAEEKNTFKQSDDEYDSQLSTKDKKDVAKRLEDMIKEIDFEGALMFNGEPMDEETKELVIAALEDSIKYANMMNKKKSKKKNKDI